MKGEDWVKGDKDYYGNFQPTLLDTLDLTKMVFGNSPEHIKFKLGNVVEYFDLEQSDAHRAMADVVPTKDVVVELIKRLRTTAGSGVEATQEYRRRLRFQF